MQAQRIYTIESFPKIGTDEVYLIEYIMIEVYFFIIIRRIFYLQMSIVFDYNRLIIGIHRML